MNEKKSQPLGQPTLYSTHDGYIRALGEDLEARDNHMLARLQAIIQAYGSASAQPIQETLEGGAEQ